MKKRSLGFLSFAVFCLLLVTPVMGATTFGGAVIDTDRTGFTVTFDGKVYTFWHISEVVDGVAKRTHALNHAAISNEGETTIDGEQGYKIEYTGVARVFITDTDTGIAIEFTQLFTQKYADATIELVYAVDGVGATLELPLARVGVHEATLQIDTAVEDTSMLGQIQEWFENIWPF